MRGVRGVVAVLGALVVAGCGANQGATPAPETGPTEAIEETAVPAETTPAATTPPPVEAGPAALRLNVADGAKDVAVDTLLTVTPTKGRVTEVEVTSTASGRNTAKVTGAIDDKGTWTARTRLDPSATYTVRATGTADDGSELAARSRFTTFSLNRNQEVFPTLTPVQGGPSASPSRW